jgi:hypothetical protein
MRHRLHFRALARHQGPVLIDLHTRYDLAIAGPKKSPDPVSHSVCRAGTSSAERTMTLASDQEE